MEKSTLPFDFTPFQNLDASTFRRYLDYYTEAYHNNQSPIDDSTYDTLLQMFEDRFGPYSQVGAVPRGETVPLPYYLGSLRKIKNAKELTTWTAKFPGPYVIEDKEDGLTLLYQILNGIYRLYTRGGGTDGLDVSHMIEYLRLPKLGFNIAVRLEVVMSKETFAKIGAGFANPRNMVSGIVNSKESFNPAIASQLHCVAYRVMDSDQTPEVQILQLKAVGFEVPYAVIANTITIEELDTLIAQREKEAPYEIDGLVIYQNRVEEYPVGENPRHVVAYKGLTESAEVTVIQVLWEASMHRLLKPVVEYSSVFLSGANLEHASGYNARWIGENGIGPGAVIRITRSGKTIPKIIAVHNPVAPSYPDPAVHGQYHYNGVDIVLNQDNNEVMAAKMKHFFKKLDIKGFGPGRIKQIVDAGIYTTAQLMQTPVEFFVSIPGFGGTLAYQVFTELQSKTKQVPLARIMAASTVFPNVGQKRLQMIVSSIPDVLQRSTDPTLASQIQQIGGFNSLAYDFVNALPIFIAWLKEHPGITIREMGSPVQQGRGDASLAGQVIVFSGFRSKEMEDQVAQRGGRVATSISGKTTLLVLGGAGKGKAEEAERRGIPIMSREEFTQRYL